MPKGKPTKVEVIISKLREAEVLLGKGQTVDRACHPPIRISLDT